MEEFCPLPAEGSLIHPLTLKKKISFLTFRDLYDLELHVDDSVKS